MPPRHLWAGPPCRRPSRSPLRHERMPLKHLWVGSPCRRTVRRPPSPREDVSEVPVGRGAVPKNGQKNSLPREDATEASVGRVAVPKGRQTTALPREHTPEVLLGDGAVPKPIAGSGVSGSQGSRFSGQFRASGG
ncbi:MAG: hypothetical protein PUC56_02940 [Bacteroidales bacterium]|nr:hypothetical protein [Bacteroidales bacterium]